MLDLLFTSHPSHIERCKTLPPLGNSDHDILLVDISGDLYRSRPPRRTIKLWKRADLEGIKSHLDDHHRTFINQQHSDVNVMWQDIKAAITEATDKCVPTKRTLARYSHPWMNSTLRRLSNRKRGAYSQAKRSNKPKEWKRYKTLKATLQRESRQAHATYMQDVVSDDQRNNPKQFWAYTKSCKQDSYGIVSLKNKDGFLHSDSATKAEILK